ncbi:MAG: TIGR00341 family protein [Thermoplasmatota archaeon]
MAETLLRLIEMIIPEDREDESRGLLKDDEKVLEFWCEDITENKILFKILVDAEKSQTVIDKLKDNFSHYDTFRLLLFHVEASIPDQFGDEEEEKKGKKKKKENEGKETKGVSREEIYADVKDQSSLTSVYILLIVLSSIVAAIGVVRNDVAVIVGAMVIAPMLGPNIALSLATTLADSDLAKKAIKTSAVGIALSLIVSIGLGIILTVNPSSAQLASRTEVGLIHVALALASGSAGALAYTKGLSSALIGVMVALALVPALATSGLLIGSGYIMLGLKALLLFMINFICINLSGVLTFIVQGFEPSTWWEADKAKRLSIKAVAIWISLLIILILGILYTQYF